MTYADNESNLLYVIEPLRLDNADALSTCPQPQHQQQTALIPM
jgi:hypothetical protein